MRTYVAVLRGVNVGGNVLKMERLRELWSELGFKNVRTYVQSGNVVFEAESSRARFGSTIEPKLASETRLPVSVIVRSAAEMGKLISINPFLKEADIDRAKLHVTFLASAPTKESLLKLNGIDAAGDRFHISRKEIYLHCPDGYGNTKLSNNALEKALSVRATTRNWNTVTTLYQMAVGQVPSTRPRLRPEDANEDTNHMSTKTLAQKLFIRERYTVLVVNAPEGYKEALGPLPTGAEVVTRASGPVDLIQVFAATKAEMDALAAKVKPLLKEGGLLWLTYPKAGQMNTDLKREVVWQCGQTVGMNPVAQIAVDDVWSALRFKA